MRRLVSLDDPTAKNAAVRPGQNPFQVAGGYRMPQCEFCPDVMYQLLMSCWADVQEQRPSAQLVAAKMPEIILETRMNKVVPPSVFPPPLFFFCVSPISCNLLLHLLSLSPLFFNLLPPAIVARLKLTPVWPLRYFWRGAAYARARSHTRCRRSTVLPFSRFPQWAGRTQCQMRRPVRCPEF